MLSLPWLTTSSGCTSKGYVTSQTAIGDDFLKPMFGIDSASGPPVIERYIAPAKCKSAAQSLEVLASIAHV